MISPSEKKKQKQQKNITCELLKGILSLLVRVQLGNVNMLIWVRKFFFSVRSALPVVKGGHNAVLAITYCSNNPGKV